MGMTLGPHLLYIDNTAALKLANHSIHHSDTIHIDVRKLFVREAAEEGLVELSYVKTTDQMTNIFMSILPKTKFLKLKELVLTPYMLTIIRVWIKGMCYDVIITLLFFLFLNIPQNYFLYWNVNFSS